LNKDERAPPTQFERVKEEMRKLERMIAEIHEGLAVARGLHKFESQRALDKSSECIELAQYWLGKAISHAVQASQLEAPR